MPVQRDCWRTGCLSRRSAINWGTRTLTPRASMPRWISPAFARWRISNWEECYESSTLDRAVHFLPTVAGIAYLPRMRSLSGLSGVPVARGPALPACVPKHVDAFLGKARPVTTTWFGNLARLRPIFQIRRQSRLPKHASSSDRDSPAATGVRSLHLLPGRNPSPPPND